MLSRQHYVVESEREREPWDGMLSECCCCIEQSAADADGTGSVHGRLALA